MESTPSQAAGEIEVLSFFVANLRCPRDMRRDSESIMNCAELAARIEQLQPDAEPRDVARLCLLLSNAVQNMDTLADEKALTSAWRDMGMKLQAATDQHAAMTEELDTLASSDPRRFSADQIWVLVRAIKVQSQILQLYVGGQVLDV